MSATAQRRPRFSEPPAADLPRLICVGTVVDVAKTKVSSAEVPKYLVTYIKLEPLGMGRKVGFSLLHHPSWLAEMSQQQINAMDKSELSVYRRHILSKERNRPSYLRILAGGQEEFENLAADLIEAGPESDIEFFSDKITEYAKDRVIGYILKQKTTKTDEKDEDGKVIYVKEDRYEIDSLFDPTEENLERLAKSAERSGGKTKMTFQGEPF